MILDLDAGNSRLKWRFSGPGMETVQGAVPWPGAETLGFLEGRDIKRIRVSSVVGPTRETALLADLERRAGVPPECARVTAEALGLRNSYADVSRMGVDRWLAMLAARHEANAAFCVVDLGTSLTMDFVDVAGRHLGGWIVPGMDLAEQAVFGGTDRVYRAKPSEDREVDPGTSTETAVRNGCLAMLAGLVRQGRHWMNGAGCPGAVVYVTGGGAPVLCPHLEGPLQHRPDLVLDGLALSLP